MLSTRQVMYAAAMLRALVHVVVPPVDDEKVAEVVCTRVNCIQAVIGAITLMTKFVIR